MKTLFLSVSNELVNGMQREFYSYDQKQGMNNLVKAAEYLHSAMDIFEEAGLTSKADQILRILQKIANPSDTNDVKQRDPSKISDRHTKGLTPERMVKNIEQHGHPMNLSDDNSVNDLLSADIDDNILEVTDEDSNKTFEDSD